MAEFRVRLAGPHDASALAALHTRARHLSIPYIPRLHKDDETLRWMANYVLPNMEVWVAETAREIVGFLALEADIVDQLYVAPDWQRRRVGSALIEKAKQRSPERLSLYCFARNAPARAFYEARGFVPIQFTDGERNEEREPDVLYRWTARN